MSVTHKPHRPGEGGLDPAVMEKIEKSIGAVQESAAAVEKAVAEVAETAEKDYKEMRAAGEKTAALLSLSFRAQIRQDRAAGTNTIGAADILAAAEVVTYPKWEPGKKYELGEILASDNGEMLFEVIAAHTSIASYPLETTFAYYRLVELEHAGTQADPIPYPETSGVVVNVANGLYYSYKGALYLAKTDMPSCVWPPDTAGLWQGEKVKKA